MTGQDYRCNDGSLDPVLGAFNSKCLRKRDQTHLRSGVVRLTKVTVQAGGRSGINNSAELLSSKDGPNGLRARIGTLEVDGLDLVPFRVGHVPETMWMGGCEFACKCVGGFRSYPLSLRIPALLIRIVIPPNASKADFMTAAPSVTDEVFTTAFPPTIHRKQ